MQRKRLKIDWEALEDAFNSQRDEAVSYLDRVTGHVVLEGEGEELDEDLDPGEARYPAPPATAPSRNDTTRVYVEPPDDEQKIEWMRVFLKRHAQIDDSVRGLLEEALASDDPVEEVGEILREIPAEREAWFLYRGERLHELIDRWLTANGIEPVDSPPWRR